jgi:hypothetical protein
MAEIEERRIYSRKARLAKPLVGKMSAMPFNFAGEVDNERTQSFQSLPDKEPTPALEPARAQTLPNILPAPSMEIRPVEDGGSSCDEDGTLAMSRRESSPEEVPVLASFAYPTSPDAPKQKGFVRRNHW